MLGLIRVALLLYPPPTRPLGPLPDPYPIPGGYLIPTGQKINQKSQYLCKKSPKKAQISYHNESNEKLSLYCVNFNLLLCSFIRRFIVKI